MKLSYKALHSSTSSSKEACLISIDLDNSAISFASLNFLLTF